MQTTTDDITISRRDWDAVMDRLAALEDATDAPAPRSAPTSPAPAATSPLPAAATPTAPVAPMLGRRRALLGLAGAAAAGVAGTVATASPAAAADGDTLKAGQTTAAANPTSLTYLPLNRDYGLGVTDGTQPAAFGSPALYAQAKGQSFFAGLYAHAQGPATGILVRSAATGIGSVNQSDSYAAVAAQNQGGGAAVSAVANGNQVLLGGGSSTAPPARVVGHNAGALTRTSNGDLWYCGASAASGWRKLAGTGTAGALHVLPTPVRAYDSRPGTTPNVGTKAPLAANGVRSLDLKANGTGVPAGATAALVTVFLVSATAGNGNFTIWRGGAARPQANTLVWGGAAGRHTVTAVTALDAAATVQVHANLSTHVVVDVVGYYR